MNETDTVNEIKMDLFSYKSLYIADPETLQPVDPDKRFGHFQEIKVWWPSADKKSGSLLKKVLEKTCCFNANVHNAGLPEDGDEKFPDIAVVDLSVFNLDMLRMNKSVYTDLLIIAIGASEDKALARDALNAGAEEYLIKPVSTECLASVIQEILYIRKITKTMPDEKRVMGVMIPIMEYTVMKGDSTVYEAIEAIKTSFSIRESTGRFLDTIHRSLMVLDDNGGVEGMVTIKNLVSSILPDYLKNMSYSDSKSLALSNNFWKGRFSARLRRLSEMTLRDIMTPPPPVIDACATLLEAALKMHSLQTRRLVVVQSNEVIGIIREQDLFFEMEKIMRRKPSVPITISKEKNR